MKIPVGTKSVLFGVHAFWFHPITVGLAWKALYGKWPRWHEWVAIFCHDLGYWNCPDMDSEQGQRHPIFGANLTEKIVLRISLMLLALRHPVKYWNDEELTLDGWVAAFELASEARWLSLGHSRFYAKRAGIPVSPLFKADKGSIYFDPKFFYLLRAHASGEIFEYLDNAKLPLGTTTSQWFDYYYRLVGKLL